MEPSADSSPSSSTTVPSSFAPRRLKRATAMEAEEELVVMIVVAVRRSDWITEWRREVLTMLRKHAVSWTTVSPILLPVWFSRFVFVFLGGDLDGFLFF